tara:strand:+ start:2731 stop:5379 length:2649 start_codon:yes stop_codon:yes gene_type:complete
MPVPKGLSKSPFEINKPKDRWRPDIDNSKKIIQQYNAPFIEKIREEVYEWRRFGYDGISNTSKHLLNYWFNYEHTSNFKYYFAQRESVESIIYLFEHKKIRNNKELIVLDSWGINEDFLKDEWLRLIIKQATGSGKTKVLCLLIAWSYFHKTYEIESPLTTNFLLISPNTIVLDRLKNDIDGLKIFYSDPIIPFNGYENKSWRFAPKVHIQDEINSVSDLGNIFLTNIQRFSNRQDKSKDYDLKSKFLGPNPSNTENKKINSVKKIVNNLDNLIVLNDEAHHVYEDTAWKRAIEDINNSLVQKGTKLVLQIDVTATPKNKKGEIFTQTISDYPLVEAIYQEVVKKPIIPDLTSREKLKEYPSSIFSEKYRDYLHLGYETWRKQYEKHKKMNKKALLFIMVDDTKNCDDVEKYMSSTFPLLKNGIFVIHTKDNTKDSTGEINENSQKGKEELQRLRRLVNTVDDLNSPIKVIISVLMLKEGWDVKNVTTIVGLRAYASHILPEQTLGRGLRRMYFGENIDEELDVIGTDNFIDYVKGISEEGVELEEIPTGENHPSSGPVVIYVDKDNPEKDINNLNIDVPVIAKRYGRDFLSLELLDPYKFKFQASKLKNYSDVESKKRIIFKDIIENSEQKTITFDNLEYITSNSVLKFFTEIILKDLGFSKLGIDHFIYEKLKIFIIHILFGQKININDTNIIRNLSEPTITAQIIEVFKKEINKLSLKDLGFKESHVYSSVADTKPYLSSRKKIYYSAKKSIFNFIAGDSNFEIEFSKYLDRFDDVDSFYKNDIQLKQSMEYIKHDGRIGSYYPDFFIKLGNGDRWIVETKGAESLNDQRKLKRLKLWCTDASKNQDAKWNCLYLRQEIWNGLKIKPNNFADLIEITKN